MFALAGSAVSWPRVFDPMVEAFENFGWHDWVWSGIALAVAIAVGRLAAWASLKALHRWAEQTDTVLDNALHRHLSAPAKIVLPVIMVRFATEWMSIPEAIADPFAHILLVVAILGAGWTLLRALSVIEAVVKERFDIHSTNNLEARTIYTQVRALRNIVGFLIGTLTIAFALMTFEAVRQLGTGLLASAGVAGIVLGFAAQRSIATVVAGLQLALAQPIRIDDVLIVEGEWGRVEEITLTYVVVRIWDLRRLVVPITYFMENPFQNWTRNSSDLLGTIEFELDYRFPVDAMREELAKVLEQTDLWDEKVSGIQITAMNARTMTVRTLVSAADASKLWNLRCMVREKLIAFVTAHYPEYFPQIRTQPLGEVSEAAQ